MKYLNRKLPSEASSVNDRFQYEVDIPGVTVNFLVAAIVAVHVMQSVLQLADRQDIPGSGP
jgi:hypothetical protein